MKTRTAIDKPLINESITARASTAWPRNSAPVFIIAAGSSRLQPYKATLTAMSIASAPSGFAHFGPADPSTTLKLRLALAHNDRAGLEEALYAVSDPNNSKYGQHLSQDEVHAFVKPSNETASKVNAWLSSHGLTGSSYSPADDWLEVSLPVAKANELLAADFSVYNHIATGTQHVRCLSYAIPADLKGHIDVVYPTVNFPLAPVRAGSSKSFLDERYTPSNLSSSKDISSTKATSSKAPSLSKPSSKAITSSMTTHPSAPTSFVAASCAKSMTPACLQALYGIPKTIATQKSNSLYVTGSWQVASESDLKMFLKKYRPDIPATTSFDSILVDGGTNPQGKYNGTFEADLDIQYTVGLAPGVPVSFLSVGVAYKTDFITTMMDEATYLLGLKKTPNVLTTSYQAQESWYTAGIARKLCDMYMQLGARGTSIIFSSGDSGVTGDNDCDAKVTDTTFPSNCPYVTSVGATYLKKGSMEVGADFSSGGFSNYFPTPAYQSAAVQGYLRKIGPELKGKFNRSGRGVPDVSAAGVDFEIVVKAVNKLENGTSCSAPTFASVVSLLNDQLIAAHKPTLGFLNPFLYSKGAAALNDVTSGNNNNASSGCYVHLEQGFPAEVGWDAITGLGTPNFVKLKAAVGL
ncbi:hypothetical protein HWV62_10949 [Athelia sp. TMB]|nr:hypothetical protein HWV62_10949 [Athelia sp. TMB]